MDKKDRPSDKIIDEDYLLDEWLRRFIFKREQDRKGIGRSSKRGSKNHSEKITFGDV